MRTIRPMLLCSVVAALLATACQREAPAPEMGNAPPRESSPGPATTSPVPAATPAAPEPGVPATTLVLFTSGTPQPFLADGSNRAVYYVEGDSDGSKCTSPCTEAWPPVLVTQAMPSAGPSLQADKVSTVQRADGTRQVTYAGHPLYRYAADAGAGRTAGNDVKDQWGHWHALAADGAPLPPPPMRKP